MVTIPKVEHCGNSVYAVHTDAGPAIYPTLDDAAKAIREGCVEVSEGDREYYDEREWLEVITLGDETRGAETMSDAITTGFYGTDTDTYYVTPAGHIWQVQSADDLGTDEPVLRESLPFDATSCDGLVTPEEALEHCRRIEAAGGEELIEDGLDA